MKHLIFLSIMFLFFVSIANGETFEGRITDVNTNQKSLTVAPTRSQMGRLPGRIELSVSHDTQLRGISSMNELKVGDEILVDADRSARGFDLNSIERSDAGEPGEYTWGEKLKRGALNIISSPVEVARSIYLGSKDENLAYGWTVGLVRGVGQGFLRFGAGVVELFTFPFEFPKEDREPLIYPEYVWEKPGVKYA